MEGVSPRQILEVSAEIISVISRTHCVILRRKAPGKGVAREVMWKLFYDFIVIGMGTDPKIPRQVAFRGSSTAINYWRTASGPEVDVV